MQKKVRYVRWGVIGLLGCTQEYAENQLAPKNDKQYWGRWNGGSLYRARCSGVSELQHVWKTGAPLGRPALFGEDVKVGEWDTRNNAAPLKFARNPRRICETYQASVQRIALHFENAT